MHYVEVAVAPATALDVVVLAKGGAISASRSTFAQLDGMTGVPYFANVNN